MNSASLTAQLRDLREQRRRRTRNVLSRNRLTATDRADIAAKTKGRCHICGGVLDTDWEADHVLAHSAGGRGSVDECLAAHSLCNNYRWNYLPEEFQWVLKIGVWARLVMEKDSPLGRAMAEQFCAYERSRLQRRRVPIRRV